MIKVMLLIILSPLAIICVMLSIGMIYVILKKIAEIVMGCVKTINDLINNRNDSQC